VRPALEVADIFRRHGPNYCVAHDGHLGRVERRVMSAIALCRTAALGGHVETCADCAHSRVAYNSCRNRHCPKCQGLAQAAWLEKRKERILPTHYFHVVFTLPEELRVLGRHNARVLYDLLFATASETLLDFGRGELGSQIGLTAVLHTWTRDLRFHPHLHCVVTGGGLDVENNRWVPTSTRFLFPVKALAARFRGKVCSRLRALHAAGALQLEGACADLADKKIWNRLVDAIYRKNWVVYAKAPFGGPEQVFQYLGRYTHRVAISNTRLVHVDEDEVRFRTRDGKHASLKPEIFIGRFLLHVLPRGFVKIRHFGLMASGNATTRLPVARQLLLALIALGSTTPHAVAEAPPALAKALDWRERLLLLTGVDPLLCLRCGGLRVRLSLGEWQRHLRALAVAPRDSS